MNAHKYIILSLMISLTLTNNNYPITTKTSNCIKFVSNLAILGTALSISQNKNFNSSQNLLCTLTGIASSYLIKEMCDSTTPKGKLNKAKKIINSLDKEVLYLAELLYKDNNIISFHKSIGQRFLKNQTPLINALNYFNNLQNDTLKAITLLKSAVKECNQNEMQIKEKSKVLINTISSNIEYISVTLAIIKPKISFNRAMHILNSLDNKTLYFAETLYKNNNISLFHKNIEQKFSQSHTPLVSAFNLFNNLHNSILQALDLLNLTKKECNVRDTETKKNSCIMINETLSNIEYISFALATIKQHPRFLSECNYIQAQLQAQREVELKEREIQLKEREINFKELNYINGNNHYHHIVK